MIESQVPPGALRARRLLLGAAVFSWIGVAASAGFVYVRSAHQHDRIARSLAWIEQNERVERDLSRFVSELAESLDQPGIVRSVVAPPDAMRAITKDGLCARDGVRALSIATIEPVFLAEGARFRDGCDALASTSGEARAAAVRDLERTTIRLLLPLGEMTNVFRRELAQAEHSLNVSGAALWLFALFALAAALLLVLLLRESTRRERWLAESRAALHESEQRFREIANAVPVVLRLADAQGRVTFSNDAWHEFQGAREGAGASEDAAGRWEELVDPADRDRVATELARAREAVAPYELEYRIRGRDGRWRWWLERGVPRRAAGGRFVGFASLSLDITDRKAFEERKLDSQRMEAMGRLAGGIAHDLNNILTVILGSVDLLVAGPPEEESLRETADEIRSAAERAAQLVAQLLAFTRRQVVAPSALDVAEVARGMAGLLRRLIGEDVELVIDAPPDPRRVTIDPAQLTQIVLNLVVNARQAMPEGGVVTIRVRGLERGHEDVRAQLAGSPNATASTEWIEIAVSDDGTGMDEETRHHVFEPFFTTKQGGFHVGLGLATVKNVVEQAGGVATVESEPEVGTTVRALLPARILDEEPPHEGDRIEPKTFMRSSATILLVEDDDAVRPLLRRYLERAGYRVVDAGRAHDAIRIAQREPTIDLLITDVVMPETGGRKLAAAIAEAHPEVRVLYMSGYTDDEVLRRGISQDEQSFLRKPFSRDSLVRRVADLLAEKRPDGIPSAGGG